MLAIVNNDAVSIRMQLSLKDIDFNFFGHTFRNGIAGSYENTIFNFLRNFHMVFIMFAPFYISTNSL